MPFDQLKIKASFSLNEKTPFKANGQQGAPASEEAPAQKLPDREVTLEEINAAIRKYADLKQSEGSRQIAIILTTAAVAFANKIITLTLNNETQKEQFLLVRQHFVDQMRIELQSSALSVEIDISQDTTQTRAYKPIDIFKEMARKNPALDELKKRFDLEIEY